MRPHSGACGTFMAGKNQTRENRLKPANNLYSVDPAVYLSHFNHLKKKKKPSGRSKGLNDLENLSERK